MTDRRETSKILSDSIRTWLNVEKWLNDMSSSVSSYVLYRVNTTHVHRDVSSVEDEFDTVTSTTQSVRFYCAYTRAHNDTNQLHDRVSDEVSYSEHHISKSKTTNDIKSRYITCRIVKTSSTLTTCCPPIYTSNELHDEDIVWLLHPRAIRWDVWTSIPQKEELRRRRRVSNEKLHRSISQHSSENSLRIASRTWMGLHGNPCQHLDPICLSTNHVLIVTLEKESQIHILIILTLLISISSGQTHSRRSGTWFVANELLSNSYCRSLCQLIPQISATCAFEIWKQNASTRKLYKMTNRQKRIIHRHASLTSLHTHAHNTKAFTITFSSLISVPKLRSLSTNTCLTDDTPLAPKYVPPIAPTSIKATNKKHTPTRHVYYQHSQHVQCHQSPTYLATQFLETDLNICVMNINTNTWLNMSSDAGVFHSLRT